MTLRAVRYVRAGESPRIGRLEAETVVDAGPAGTGGFAPTEEAWSALAAAKGVVFPISALRLLAPVVPSKVVCVGLNYRAHAAETGAPIPEKPILFAKYASALIGHEEPIVVPFDEPQTDFEAEVAIVIGSRVRRADRATARAAVGGVTAFNDVSGRIAQLCVPGGQWTHGKSFDTFGPIGPSIACADDLDLADISVRCVVSGEEMQTASTADLIHDAEAIVVHCSAAFTLEPGDVIATGTPGGVGFGRTPPRYLRRGDVVEVHVDHVGVLRNPVVDEQH